MEFNTELLNKLLRMKGDGIKHVEASSHADAVLKSIIEITDLYRDRIGEKISLQFATTNDDEAKIGESINAVLKALGAVTNLDEKTGILVITDFPTLSPYIKVGDTHYGTKLFPQFNPDTWEVMEDAVFVNGVVLDPLNKETHEPLIVLRADKDPAQKSCVFSVKNNHHHASSDELRKNYALTNVRMDKSGLTALKVMLHAGVSKSSH